MAVHSLTGVMGQFDCLLVALDANVRLYFDDLDPLPPAKALHDHDVVHSTLKNAQVLGMLVQAGASYMFAQHVHDAYIGYQSQ